MKNADLSFRNKLIEESRLSDGYNEEMEELHIQNATKLEMILNEIGYPTIDKVGTKASESAWIIIQHSISRPHFMKKCLILLEKAVSKNKASKKNLAYLSDRIATFEGKPQLYGTQFDWDEDGKLSPNKFDNLTKVNERRKSIGLNTLEEQIVIIRKQTEKENQTPPKNQSERKKELDLWRKKVGWL